LTGERKDGRTPNTILIRRTGALGDVLLASSVLRPVKNRFPGHDIDFATATPEILVRNPFIKNILPSTVDVSSYTIFYDLDFAYELRPRCSILDSYAAVVGIPANELHLGITINENAKQQAERVLKANGIRDNQLFAAVQTAGSFWVKNWPVEAYKQVIDALNTRLGIKSVVLGSSSDPAIDGAVDLRGVTDIMTGIAIISRCVVFIGVDSFLLHCAKAVGRPVAAFFGHSDPNLRIIKDNKDLIFVSDIGCRFCHHRHRPPVFTPICRKQNIGLQILDMAFQKIQHLYYVNKSNFWAQQRHRLWNRLVWREKGKIIAQCMKDISPSFATEKTIRWLQAVLSLSVTPLPAEKNASLYSSTITPIKNDGQNDF
jgi:ADP-heptose:LPS heptosyltransferase